MKTDVTVLFNALKDTIYLNKYYYYYDQYGGFPFRDQNGNLTCLLF